MALSLAPFAKARISTVTHNADIIHKPPYGQKSNRYPASKASVEGKAPSGFAGGGGDASPYNKRLPEDNM